MEKPKTKPEVADTVLYIPRPRTYEAANDAKVIPAIVTNVFGDGSLVNLKAFTDGPDNIWLPSTKYDSRGTEPGTFHLLRDRKR